MAKLITEYPEKFVFFDLETTGLSSDDEVIEISALKVVNGKIVEEFDTLVNPGMPIPDEASMVNGITDDMVKDKPGFETVLKAFLQFVADAPLAGHNINSFDMKFIRRDAMKYFGKEITNDTIDTLPMARACLPDLPSKSLGCVAEHYGIDSSGAHRSLADCHMNKLIFDELIKEVGKLEKCPKCGQLLTKRNGRFGAFYGCTGYPECRYTRNI
ncbi:MAG: topoisomerase DNA-binding C4 zinc finger domain-containing protein [Erysipelotrichaceae bacterium]|nr:topoisomerase DNA-binding C4 zinc finger domain-containing protein [Erysipelotrichaceae bacterium]